jgi:hypothetical protein
VKPHFGAVEDRRPFIEKRPPKSSKPKKPPRLSKKPSDFLGPRFRRSGAA